MINRIGLVVLIATGSLWMSAFKPFANAQQTLGGITGTVSDKSGGVLPELVYKKAIERFGEESTAELIYLVGLYCMVSVTLNGFDVPVPE